MPTIAPPMLADLTIDAVAGHGASGPVWSGRWRGQEVLVRRTPKGALPITRQRQRLRKLQQVVHPGIARIIHVEETGSEFIIVNEFIHGPQLATVRTGSQGLPLAAGWRLLADLTGALAAVHEEGIIHGDVSPANVVVADDEARRGRAVLIDVGAEAVWELGTAGFRAPEIAAGAPAAAASDVWSAARVAVWAVQETHRLSFADLLGDVLAEDPAIRPTARELSASASAQAGPAINLPDRASLASAHLRSQAALERTEQARTRLPFLRRGGARPSRAGSTGRGRIARPRHRSRVSARPRPATLVKAAVFLGLVAVTVLGMGALNPRSAGPAAEPPNEAQAEPSAPVAAMLELTRHRDLALSQADPDLLATVTVPGSPAALADRDLLGRFGSDAPGELRTDVRVAAVADGDHGPVLTVYLTQQAFEWVGGPRNGVRVAQTPTRCARIELQEHEGQWRVRQVSACAADAMSG